jgi:hypothetical protein
MTPLCFIDTETTGVHPDRRVWEVAMIRRDDNGQHETSFFVEVDLSNADPFGLNVGRFYDRHPHYAGGDRARGGDWLTLYSEKEAAQEVEEWTRGAHLVGAVPDFDARTLDPMLRRHGLIPAWHYHLIDVEAMAVGYLAALRGRGVPPPWKSDALSLDCDVKPPSEAERHTALGDARWAMRWYDAMTGGAA